MLRATGFILASVFVVSIGLFLAAGRSAPPSIVIVRPDRAIGQDGQLEVTAEAPRARLTSLTMTLEQDGRLISLFSLDQPESATITQVDVNRVRISRSLGKGSVPELRSGRARLVVAASRPSFLNLRTLSSVASQEFEVRLEPPRIALVSTHHYINHGGAEMVVYRVTPPDVRSGVRVGDVEYAGYPASDAGVTGADPALKVALLALLSDQDLLTPIAVFARDEAGNESTAPFVDQRFPKPFRRSRIDLDERFLRRVVPDILQHSPDLNESPPSGDLLPSFLRINRELRHINAERIAALTSTTGSVRLWSGPFVQLGRSAVEASFADHRTYFYGGREVDQQVHLGFDLAVTAQVPVVAANTGKVLHAGWLGIYGNCVIIDHGLGVSSLYGHLSSIDVRVGDTVGKEVVIGKSGMTGLAGGDHLHFTMLLGGRPVNPVEWWDSRWMEDRIERKLAEARSAVATRSN